ncbi:hypothetical protein H6F50_21285 [Coleofasciculus sp. FACHB-712]|uniref:hypothetical protein n=1 Tax=Coleofasciculus sp. FACHB-712 TaxID=2692789 RepID=UPI0016884EED|nr:hypothetical protein [Coleofasciculus sp. FACHB-712]MBD1944860.1 hypothetical protein [Coleofasciculus sp. FACHB-712]
MAENLRVRIETDIQDYLKSQSERVIGKPSKEVTGADITTLTNRIIYEHKIAQSMAKQVPFAKLFSWVMGLVPSSGSNKVVAFNQGGELPTLNSNQSKLDDLSFDADLGDLFEDEAA